MLPSVEVGLVLAGVALSPSPDRYPDLKIGPLLVAGGVMVVVVRGADGDDGSAGSKSRGIQGWLFHRPVRPNLDGRRHGVSWMSKGWAVFTGVSPTPSASGRGPGRMADDGIQSSIEGGASLASLFWSTLVAVGVTITFTSRVRRAFGVECTWTLRTAASPTGFRALAFDAEVVTRHS